MYDKAIVIDCAQFHCIKDISLLRGTLIAIRPVLINAMKELLKDIN